MNGRSLEIVVLRFTLYIWFHFLLRILWIDSRVSRWNETWWNYSCRLRRLKFLWFHGSWVLIIYHFVRFFKIILRFIWWKLFLSKKVLEIIFDDIIQFITYVLCGRSRVIYWVSVIRYFQIMTSWRLLSKEKIQFTMNEIRSFRKKGQDPAAEWLLSSDCSEADTCEG